MTDCFDDDCDSEAQVRGLCRRHYKAGLRHGDFIAGDTASQPGVCPRCQRQLAAYDADEGRGDRPLLAGTMTQAEAGAYCTGFHDGGSDTGPIDPYIVARLDELRGE